MTSVNEMNAVIRERERIRAEIMSIENSQVERDAGGNVWIPRGRVLAILTENIINPTHEEEKNPQ